MTCIFPGFAQLWKTPTAFRKMQSTSYNSKAWVWVMTKGGDQRKHFGREHSHLICRLIFLKHHWHQESLPCSQPFHSPSLPSHHLQKKIHTLHPGTRCHTSWAPPDRSAHCLPNDSLAPIFQLLLMSLLYRVTFPVLLFPIS